MSATTIAQIEQQLRRLPPEKLNVVYDFVSYLADRQRADHTSQRPETTSSWLMIAAEPALRRDWDRPEEDEAWADL